MIEPWEPGKHGNGIVFVDETVVSWSVDPSTGLPGHEHGLRASGQEWEDVLTFLIISPDGEAQLRSPMQNSLTADLRRTIANHDSRMHLDDGSSWADMFASPPRSRRSAGYRLRGGCCGNL